MRKILLLACAVLLLSSPVAWAQERTVSGKVTSSEDGTPLPGVNVVLKGTTIGTATDADGKYSLTISAANANSAALVFSFIGLQTQEIPIGDRTVVDVALTLDATQLNEIIVSGVAGATSREKLTVSVTKVGAERLNVVTAMSLSSALSGKVAGVRISNPSGSPGGSADVLLRADNNLPNVNSSPLIMIDGMIMTGSLSEINADDVESFEVIKGAAASALYGSRAGNGVIFITTKRGANLNQNSVKVNVRNEVGFQQVARNLDVATHHPFALAADADDFRGEYTKYAGVTYPLGYTGGGWHPDITGNRTIDADHYMDNKFGVTKDQQDLFFNTGINYTNYISVQSRSNNSNVMISFENMSQSGIIENTDGYKRQNFRINYDVNVAPWLKISTSNLYINSHTNTPGNAGTFFNIVLAEPDANLYQKNPDGQPYYLRMNQFSGETINPLYQLWKTKRDNYTRRWLGNYSANIELTDWANIDVNQSIEIQNRKASVYNPYDTWTPTGGTDETFGMSYTRGSLSMQAIESRTLNTQVTLNLAGRFGDFNVRGKLSYLYENRESDNFSVASSQFAVNNVPTFDNFVNINDASSGFDFERAQNYFAIVGGDWKEKVLVDGMFRYDGSSLFGPDSRWNAFYRMSLGYIITKDFTIPGVDFLKVRAAHGTAGIRPGSYTWQFDTFSGSNGAWVADQRGNPALKPSKTAETEFGLNANFLRRFNLEVVYAQSKTTDQFLNRNIPPFADPLGFRYRYENAGTVESKTFEFTLGANWMEKPNFTWTSNIVFSRIRQEITELPIPAYNYGTTDGGAQPIFYVREGETYGSMYGYTWVRSLSQMEKQLPAGKTIADYEINSDGYVIDAGTEGTALEKAIKLRDAQGNFKYTKIGDGNADFNLGVANTLTYKGISLYFLFDIKVGGDVYNSKSQWITRDLRHPDMDMSGVAPENKKAYDYWVNFYDVNTPNSYWVEDASFVKLREFAIGYDLPKSLLTKFVGGAFKGVNIKFVGRNLLTFTKYSGYDPEVGSVREPYDGTNKYPNFRNMAVSLSLDF